MNDALIKVKSHVIPQNVMKGGSPQQPFDEPVLVARAAVEPAAFTMLYDHYFPLVHKYVLYRVRDAQVADELVSQVFERMFNHLNRYRPGQAPFGSWLFGIARHVVGNHFRTLKHRRWLSIEGLRHLASQEPAPEDEALKSELTDRLLAAVSRLPGRDRDLIGLKFAAGLNNRQIAALTGLSESNVGVIIYRAMQHLRGELIEMEPSHD